MAVEKRKHPDDDTELPAKKKLTRVRGQENSLLFSLLEEGGIYDRENDSTVPEAGSFSRFCCTDSTLLRRLVDRRLRMDPSAVTTFVDNFSAYVSDNERLIDFLLPIQPNSARYSTFLNGDSVVKILLGSEYVQPQLVDILLDKIPEFLVDDEKPMTENVPRLILSQFRFLECSVNGSELATKLLELLEVVPTNVKRDIISYLPEIVEDSEHERVVGALQTAMEDDSSLTVPILDCISNLSLEGELMDQVVTRCLLILGSSAVEDLPVVIRFLLQAATTESSTKIVQEIRGNLKFESFGADEGENLALDAVRAGVRFQVPIQKAFLKAIESSKTADNHCILDIWVLVIILGVVSAKRKAEILFKKKVLGGQFTFDLLNASIEGHSSALRELFPTFLAAAESFCQSSDVKLVEFGSCLYTCLFLHFDDAYHRQEVLGNLITHTGSGLEREVDTGLDTLVTLVLRDISAVRNFTAFVQGILDYLESFNVPQIRKVYSIFAYLAFGTTKLSVDRSMQDDLYILIRKQLGHPSVKYKRIGILGAITVVQRIGVKDENDELEVEELPLDSQEMSLSQIEGPGRLQQSRLLLETMMGNCSKSPMCLSFLFDELEAILEDLDEKLVEWIFSTVSSSFEEQYLADLPEPGAEVPKLNDDEEQSVGLKPWGNIDEETCEVMISILPLLMSSAPESRDSLLCLCSQFRLMGSAALILEDNLENLDALLSCPLQLADMNGLGVDDIETTAIPGFDNLDNHQKDAVCLSYYYAINWVREVVNLFHTQSDAEMKEKVLRRLKDVILLEKQFNALLARHKRFQPPGRNNAEQPKKGRRFGEDKTASLVPETDTVHVAPLRQSFRTLNVQVLRVIPWQVSRRVVNTQSQLEEQNDTTLDIESVNYLLREFEGVLGKLHGSPHLCGSGKQRVTLCVDTLKGILPHIKARIEDTLGTFRDAEADDATPNEERLVCLELTFCCFERLTNLISASLDQASLLGFLSLFEGVNRADGSQIELAEAQKWTFAYFENMGAVVPKLSTANALIRLLKAIVDCNAVKSLSPRLSDVAETFLKRDWGIKYTVSNLSSILSAYVKFAKSPEDVIAHMSAEEIPDLDPDSRDSKCKNFSTLTKSSLPLYYKVLFEELIANFSRLSTHSAAKDGQAFMRSCGKLVGCFERLIQISKSFDTRAMHAIALKQSKTFLTLFLKYMPLISRIFRRHQDDVIKMFKCLQMGTRSLQTVCANGKVNRDSSLLPSVPFIRRSLETLIFKVKEMLFVNDCGSAFWIGTLKHRNLKGGVVNSQVPQDGPDPSELLGGGGDSEGEDNDEEIREIEEAIEETIEGRGTGSSTERNAAPRKRRNRVQKMVVEQRDPLLGIEEEVAEEAEDEDDDDARQDLRDKGQKACVEIDDGEDDEEEEQKEQEEMEEDYDEDVAESEEKEIDEDQTLNFFEDAMEQEDDADITLEESIDYDAKMT